MVVAGGGGAGAGGGGAGGFLNGALACAGKDKGITWSVGQGGIDGGGGAGGGAQRVPSSGIDSSLKICGVTVRSIGGGAGSGTPLALGCSLATGACFLAAPAILNQLQVRSDSIQSHCDLRCCRRLAVQQSGQEWRLRRRRLLRQDYGGP